MSIGRFISTTNVGVANSVAAEYDTNSASSNRNKLSGYRDLSVMGGGRVWRSTLDYTALSPPYQVAMSTLRGTARLPPITVYHGLSTGVSWYDSGGTYRSGFVSPADAASYGGSAWALDLPATWTTGNLIWGFSNYGYVWNAPGSPGINLGSLSGGIASATMVGGNFIPAFICINDYVVTYAIRQILYNSTRDEIAVKIGSNPSALYYFPSATALTDIFAWSGASGSESPSSNPFFSSTFTQTTVRQADNTVVTYTSGANGQDYTATYLASGYGAYASTFASTLYNRVELSSASVKN